MPSDGLVHMESMNDVQMMIPSSINQMCHLCSHQSSCHVRITGIMLETAKSVDSQSRHIRHVDSCVLFSCVLLIQRIHPFFTPSQFPFPLFLHNSFFTFPSLLQCLHSFPIHSPSHTQHMHPHLIQWNPHNTPVTQHTRTSTFAVFHHSADSTSPPLLSHSTPSRCTCLFEFIPCDFHSMSCAFSALAGSLDRALFLSSP